MNRPFCASNKQLEKKWNDMAYQRHRERLKTIKPKIQQELTKNRQEQHYRIQRRMMRVMGEERRQEIIAKENQQLLMRILNIMTSPSRIDTWNTSYITLTNSRKERKLGETLKETSCEKQADKKEKTEQKSEESGTQLPPLQG